MNDMKQDHLENTQIMKSADTEQDRRAGRTASLSDTQSMPPVREETIGIKPPFPQKGAAARTGTVRELSPEKQTPAKKKSWLTPKRKKALLLGGGFLAALFIGFMIAGYSQQQSLSKQQEQQLQDRQRQLADQETDLKARRAQLEQQKKELQERQRQLESEASRAQGRNEQLRDSAPGSALGRLVDKVTGRESKRNRQVSENDQKSSQAAGDASAVGKSVEEAQSMLDDVNAKLDQVTSMKQEAAQLKDKAVNAYDANKGMIDQAVYYAKVGAGMLENWLSR